jgi:tRNA modification GTPase
MHQNETIAAIATAPGDGAIAVIRISGPTAFEVAERICAKPMNSYQSHKVHLDQVLDREGRPLDRVVLIPFRAPRSYTGEHVVEIHCHGGSLIARKVLERVLEGGARMAHPGEFTFQAFRNGKLDLAQAEAVQQLIASKNDLARNAANQQLEGVLSKRISDFQKQLIDIAAIIEAWVDFPEEGLEFSSMEELLKRLEREILRMRQLASTFHHGKTIQTGLSLCLIGAPNVGKSSLMNALLGFERAIVTELPGTTRDLLEEPFCFGSLHFRLIDTAGVRTTEERIEQEGIRRSHRAMQEADLILLLLDASRPLQEEDRQLLLSVSPQKTLLVWNKVDLTPPNESIEWEYTVQLSAKERTGLDVLCTTLERMIWKRGMPPKDEIILTSARHFEALSLAIESLEAVVHGFKTGISPEFLSFELRSCLLQLSTIVGTNVSEEILSSIFSQFCLGK